VSSTDQELLKPAGVVDMCKTGLPIDLDSDYKPIEAFYDAAYLDFVHIQQRKWQKVTP
jgi:hypothetical protein